MLISSCSNHSPLRCCVESDLVVDASGIADLQDYELVHNGVANPTKKRISSITFYPRDSKVVVASGDKQGKISLWASDADTTEDSSCVVTHRAHKSLVTHVFFNPADDSKLISASVDGSVRQLDVDATAFTQLYTGKSSISSFAMGHSVFLISREDGSIVSLDHRAPKSNHSSYHLHEKRINTVHIHPLLTQYVSLVTYSLSCLH